MNVVGWDVILFRIFLEPPRARWERFVTNSREEPFTRCWLNGCQRSHVSAAGPEDWKQKGYLFLRHRLYPQIDFSYLIRE